MKRRMGKRALFNNKTKTIIVKGKVHNSRYFSTWTLVEQNRERGELQVCMLV